MSSTIAQCRQSLENSRKLLLHLKCLFWCLHQMQTRYDLNLVLYSFEHKLTHPEIADSNLGDNVGYLLEHVGPEDISRLCDALRNLPETVSSQDTSEKHFEIGHYMQAINKFGTIPDGSYGVISSITPQLRGLFYVDQEKLVEVPFAPKDIQVIFGTYIV